MSFAPDPNTAPLLIDAVPCPGGVELIRAGVRVNRLSPIEARRLAARLLEAAGVGEPLTAEGGGPLLDPDCRVGKHTSCVGDPCECPCHTSGIEGVRP